jgi:tRNA U38,U39,U40 pseudouridine synthase TruA
VDRRNYFMAYISITGLKLNSIIHAPRFWWHAIRSMMQAKSAAGNISTATRTINGVHHTVSVWESSEAMRAYLLAGAHIKAMRIYKKIATGKVLGFEADAAPPWDEVHELWKTKGREV